jgi:hypothetical protein
MDVASMTEKNDPITTMRKDGKSAYDNKVPPDEKTDMTIMATEPTRPTILPKSINLHLLLIFERAD